MTAFCQRSQLDIFQPTHKAFELSRHLKCPDLVASVMEMRGIEDMDKARAWLSPSLSSLLPSMYLGANALETAKLWRSIDLSGNVVVYGDYDVDGISSTVLAMELSRMSGARNVRYYIPHRREQGYGLHRDVLKGLIRSGCDTLIIVDCGSKDTEILSDARKAGLQVFVFDHHLLDEGYVAPSYVVNPQIDGDTYSRELCATGVLWVWAFLHSGLETGPLLQKLDLVALATLADCMPLNILNRSMVSHGLKVMKQSPRRGIMDLFRKLDLSLSHLTEEHLSMKVIPCLNAAGRLELADPAVNLLVGLEPVSLHAERLVKLNRRRQELSSLISGQVAEAMDNTSQHVLLDEQWPVGVLSGVASRVCNLRGQPVILAAPGKKGIRGTVRVPAGGNAIAVLDSVSEYLQEWGGHRFAAGFSVSRENWRLVREQLEFHLGQYEDPELSVQVIEFDPSLFDRMKLNELSILSPFGQGNPVPMFYHPRSGTERFLPLGKSGDHHKITSASFEILAFNTGAFPLSSDSPDPVGWVYHPRLDVWRGKPRVQLILDYMVIPD